MRFIQIVKNAFASENEKRYHCLWGAHYEIVVNRSFYFCFLHYVTSALCQDKELDQHPDLIKRDEFSTLAILLKFKPHCAVLYLGYFISMINFRQRPGFHQMHRMVLQLHCYINMVKMYLFYHPSIYRLDCLIMESKLKIMLMVWCRIMDK